MQTPPRTIYPRFQGGCGNQLFQIAATIGFARRYGYNYRFPLPDSVFMGQGNPPSYYRETLFRKLPLGEPSGNAVVLSEQRFSFHDLQLPDADEIILDGFWQSTRYWDHCRDEVLGMIDTSWCKLEFPAAEETCAVHVRGGDTFASQTKIDFHHVCAKPYYDNAIACAREHGIDSFAILTDDPLYSREVAPGHPVISSDRRDDEELVLMSRARAIIGANSTFSWWAAMLGNQRLRIFPEIWFGPSGPADFQDVVPKDWIKVPVD